jgi:hypothetical protein
MNVAVNPPGWAERLLRAFLRPDVAETVTGDLLEEYRATVYPLRGHWGADLWFVRQVAGFVWRTTWMWGVLLSALIVGRTALDWFVPPADFKLRAIVTTYAAMGIFVAVGVWAAYRTRSVGAGALAGLATGTISFVLSLVGHLALLAIWHDPHTMWAIERSGGLGELFMPTLPGAVTVVGTFLASVGGLLGKFLGPSTRQNAVS